MAPMARERSTAAGSAKREPLLVRVAGVAVHPISKSLIKPATPTKSHWLSLSNLDRTVNPTFSSVILFYKDAVNEHQSFQDVTKSLKESLSKVLVYFYPLAGRLAVMNDGLVNLHCNDEGAVFLEASVDADLDSVGGAKPMPALSGLDFTRLSPGLSYVPDQLKSMPALVVMVTNFKCGSVAVAVNWHLNVADGYSGCHFVKSWAEVSNGNLSPSLTPVHDRSLLRARKNGGLIRGHSKEFTDADLNSGLGNRGQEQRPTWAEPPVQNSFHINKEMLELMKEKVTSESQVEEQVDSVQYTSAECISAYLWWQMTISRRAISTENDDASVTRFFMFMDGRKSMSLPEGYFGTVLCSACATAKVGDIISKPLSYAASLIRNATTNISGEYFRSLIDWVEHQRGGGGGSSYKPEHMNSLGRDVAALFWTSFPLYEMDFGWGGKPELAARNSPPRALIDGIAILPSKQGPDDVVALLNLHADRMNRLTMQDSFRAVFADQAS